MRCVRRAGVGIVFLCVSMGVVHADLKVGDFAPGIDATPIRRSVPKLAGGRITVVEFWATWCGPCRRTAPYLSKVQEHYSDRKFNIVGVSTEDRETVLPYVQKMGMEMAYSVAIDNKRATYKAYMDASGADKIPHAFIVDRQGKLAWHGNPLLPEFAEVLEDLMPKRKWESSGLAPKLLPGALTLAGRVSPQGWGSSGVGHTRLSVNPSPRVAVLDRNVSFTIPLRPEDPLAHGVMVVY